MRVMPLGRVVGARSLLTEELPHQLRVFSFCASYT